MVGFSSLSPSWPQENGTAVIIGGSVGAVALGYLLYSRSSKRYQKSPSSFQLSGGAVDAKKVKETVRRPLQLPLCSAVVTLQ